MITQSEITRLLELARKASQNAYAPYSKYAVGAAVMDEQDRIFTGCNIENASYGLTICAERTAIFNARCNGAVRFKAIAVYTPKPPLPVPCGACLQVMAEGGNRPVVIVGCHEEQERIFAFEDLLPKAFSL
ncbi:cytidine deaminase [bacterium]|nr:cytidine deaminase [candidate division CSSED10-310 bacterium]